MQLNKISEVLSEDYHCRRQMMLKRFQVTLESFAWGDKQKVCASVSCCIKVNVDWDFSFQLFYKIIY